MSRQQRRAIERAMGKEATQQVAEKIAQLSKLPSKCSACQKGFDNTDKEMASSWSVVARQEVVRLFCPECIKKTQEAIEHVSKKNI
jgi:ribosomal protein L44E